MAQKKAIPWRPWQFSLRFILLLMLVVSAFLAGWQANEFRRERKSATAIPARIAPRRIAPTSLLKDEDFQTAAFFSQFQRRRHRLGAEEGDGNIVSCGAEQLEIAEVY